MFQFASSLGVLEVNRDEEFSPIKNATGKDSASSARAALYALNRARLLAAGATFVDDSGAEVSSSGFCGARVDSRSLIPRP